MMAKKNSNRSAIIRENLELLIPEPPKEWMQMRWGTVNAAGTQVMLDGDTVALPAQTVSLVPLVPGSRVAVDRHGKTTRITGTVGGVGGAGAVDFLTDLKAPVYIGHRGSPVVYPEHSLEGYRAVALDGFCPEQDVRELADGTLVCIHDATTNRTMDVNATVASMTKAEWLKARINPAVKGGDTAQPALFEHVLDDLGGTILLLPELKTLTVGACDKFIAAIKKRGLERAVIVQCSNYDLAVRMAQAGLAALFLVGTGSAIPFSQMVADGIQYIGPSRTAPASVIADGNAAGLRSLAYTMLTKEQGDTQLARGAFGLFCDDPWTVSDQIPVKTVFEPNGTSWPGAYGYTRTPGVGNSPATHNQWRINVDGVVSGSELNGNIYHLNLPVMGLVKPPFKLYFDVNFERSGTQTSLVGFYLWKNLTDPTALFEDAAVPGQWGYTGGVRRNGNIHLWKYLNGSTASAVASSTGTTIAPENMMGTATMMVHVTSTEVMISSNSAPAVTVADTSNIGDLQLGIRWARSRAEVRNIRYENL